MTIYDHELFEPRRFPYEQQDVHYLPDFTIAAYDVTIRTTDGRHKLVFTREPSATQVEGGWYYRAPAEGVVAMVILERRWVFAEDRMNAYPAVAVIDLSAGFESNE